ncbi:nitrogenase component 1 [Geotalea sp. SG265]|uniref:nitrogenase component 1 n=1 Tax=Geotalea sp. SG265 TaxID=2922867 RepID=UPI001FAF6FF3|nr:nitrogenase component 1 [Geotalea sp. SG265]
MSIDLKANTCPNREQRAGAVNAYYGKASDLVQEARNGTLTNKEREFQQSSGCVLNFYLTTRVVTIRDAVMIVHAPVGCSSTSLLYREVYRRIPLSEGRPADFDLHWLTTNIDEKDVVYGGADKLRFAIREAEERYKPKAIFVLASCTSGIIGEDIEGVVAEVQPEINATIVPVHCEGIRSRIIQTAYDAFWHGILKYLVKKDIPKQPDLVNIASMLSYTWQDRKEITRLLNRIGLRPNFIPEFATVEQFEILGAAAVTAPICPTYTDYLSRGLEQEFGVPCFMYPSPVGIDHTDEWLRTIARYTGKEKEVEVLIKEEREKWLPQMEKIQNEFASIKPNGEKVEILGSLGQGRLLTQVPYFEEIGVSSPAAIIQDFDNLVLDEVQGIIDQAGDFDVLVNTFQAAELAHITRKYDPDVALTCPFQGSAYKREKGATRIHALRGDARQWSAQAGYKGAIAYGNFLLQSLKNKAFQKTMLAKTPDSYKDWWYEQPDPLHFTKQKGV